MALTFGATGGERVEADGYQPDWSDRIVVVAVLRPTSLADGYGIAGQHHSTFGGGWYVAAGNGTGGVRFRRYRTSGQTHYLSADCLVTDEWQVVVCATHGSYAPGDVHRLWHAPLGEALVPISFSSASNSAGSYVSGTLRDLTVGNINDAASNSWRGGIGRVGCLIGGSSVVEDAEAQQLASALIYGTPFPWTHSMDLGANGTGTQVDLSGHGHHGTVSGATLADGPPLPRWRRGRVLYVPVAAAVGGGGISGSADCEVDAAAAGTGALDLSGEAACAADATAAASGELAIAGEGTCTAEASADATGVLAIAAVGTCSADASCAATGTLGGAAVANVTVEASCAGTGSLAIVGGAECSAGASCEGTGAVLLRGAAAVSVEASAGGEGALPVSGEGAGQVDATCNGTGRLRIEGVGACIVTASVSATSGHSTQGAAACTVEASCEATGALRLEGVGACSAGASVVASGAVVIAGAGSCEAAAVAQASGTLSIGGAALCVVPASVVATSTLRITGQSVVIVGAAVAAVGLGTAPIALRSFCAALHGQPRYLISLATDPRYHAQLRSSRC